MTNLQIAKLYVAVNGTAPTAAELATLSASATTAADIMAMVDFTGADNTATLNAAYQAAFGRDADAEGLAYWGAELTAGNVTGATLMEKLLVGADVYVSAGDATIAALNTADKGITANKATVALEIATAGLTATEAATALALVTATDTAAASASVAAVVDAAAAAAQAEEDAAAAVGQTIVFTTAIDALTGTTGNDTFVGDNTLTTSAADQIAGSTGTDTVKIYNDSATALTMPVMDSIENLYVKGLQVNDDQDISGLGIDSLELDTLDVLSGTAATVITYAADQKIILDSVINSVVGTTVAGTVAAFDSLTVAAKTATVTSADIELDGVNATNATTDQQALAGLVVTLTGAGVKTLNLTASGDDSVAIINNTALTTINVDGAADLSLDVDLATALKTFDASAATGDVTVDVSNSAVDMTINGGAGDDSLTADLSLNLTVDAGAGDDTVTFASVTVADLDTFDTIDGGEGTDTLALSGAGADAFDASTKLAQITNFEALEITNDIGTVSATVIDISKFGFNTIKLSDELDAGAGTDATVTGITSGGTVIYNEVAASTDSLIVTMTGATGAGTTTDTLNVDFNGNLTADNYTSALILDIAGINILNIDANDSLNTDLATTAAAGYTLDISASGNDANVSAMNLTGTAGLTFSIAATATALSTFDASASSGDMVTDLQLFAGTQGIVYTGSAGIDTVTSTDFADLITLGAGKDVYTIATNNEHSTELAMDKISDFDITGAGDKLDLIAGILSADVTGVDVSGAAVAADSAVEINAKVKDGILTLSGDDASTIDTLGEWIDVVETANVIDGVANAALAVGAVAFEFDGNTYVYDSNSAGNTTGAATTSVLELTGVTGVTSLSVANTADSIFIG